MAREGWSGQLGVVMAVAGSAIGLGNFLRFPGQAAVNGGGAFMIPYFIALVFLGLPLVWIEWTIGRYGGRFGHSTAPGIIQLLWRKNRLAKYLGVIGLLGPLIIYLYYVYVESWLLGYSFFAAAGRYDQCTTSGAMLSFLHGYQGLENNRFFSGLGPAYLFYLITFGLNGLILYFGVRKGIEQVCRYGLPLLFVLALVLLLRVFLLGAPDPSRPENNVVNGLGYLWNPDWTALLRPGVWLAAAGQIFFTLSCGQGIILTYASYLRRDDDVALSSLTAASANEFAEVVLGGSLVIPAAFAFFGGTAIVAIAEGGIFNLGFVTMPLVLQRLTFGNLFGCMWFLLLFIAGITSSISLAQPAVAFLQDEFGLSRRRAVFAFMGATFLLTQPVILFLGRGVLDELDFWGGSVLLVLFATVETILFGWVFGLERGWRELHAGAALVVPRFYRFVIKYVTPLILLTILALWLFMDWLPVLALQGIAEGDRPFIVATRLALVALGGGLVWLVRLGWQRRAAQEATDAD